MIAKSQRDRGTWLSRSAAIFLGALSLALLAGGCELAAIGGSFYYAIAGVVCTASAVGIWRLKPWGAGLYGAFLIATLAWAISESGFYAWALAPRLVGPGVLGGLIFFATRSRAAKLGLAATVAAIAIVMTAASILPTPDTIAGVVPARANGAPGAASADWPHYGGDLGGTRFSPLADITPANVSQLKLAWSFRMGAGPPSAMSHFEATPIEIGDTLYICAAYNDVIALDAATGREKWRFDAHVDPGGVAALTCRGAAYYRVPGATGLCATRILTGTVDARLIALDTATGTPCPGFGMGGTVDLTAGLGSVLKGYYYVTSAPAIVRGKIVLGGWVSDGQMLDEPSGVIRGFDAVTGQLAWAWDMGHPDRHGAPPPGEHFARDTPNSWAPISADEALGLVFLPTGPAKTGYYGTHRSPESERFSSSVIAIDADTGILRWSFQTTHHDIWDYDAASQPTLLDVTIGGQEIPALLQPTKRGEIFLLDRRTGKPLADVAEIPAPRNAAPGETPSPTQPYSVGMPGFGGPRLTEAMMWGITPLDQLWCRITFRTSRYFGPMTPVGLNWTIVYPGFLGGVDWGGVSVDAERQLMIVNSNRMANFDRLMSRQEADARGLRPATAGHYEYGDGALPQTGVAYAVAVRPFLSPIGVPCQQPPYGLISAVDLRSRRIVWQKPFGTAAGSGPFGLRSRLPLTMGVPNLGGSVTTRGGLVFIAASQDGRFRALDASTGSELWSAPLPAGGQATPMTYKEPGGRQLVVIVAGGHYGLHTQMGDYIEAFALPRSQ